MDNILKVPIALNGNKYKYNVNDTVHKFTYEKNLIPVDIFFLNILKLTWTQQLTTASTAHCNINLTTLNTMPFNIIFYEIWVLK